MNRSVPGGAVMLSSAVHQHFADPTVRAYDIIAGYRAEMIRSVDLPQMAAEVVADLPGAGESWTELAMASSDMPRSDLLPTLERAADEIGYARSVDEAESDILEGAAYRAVVEGCVGEESHRLQRVDFEADHDRAFTELRDAWGFAGDDWDDQIRSARDELVTYLNARYRER